MRVQLTLLDGEKIDTQVPLDAITIGRSNKCDVVIPQESMSRQHCKVEIKDGEFFITDLGSINGVYVDGKKINPNTPTSFQTYLNVTFGCVVNGQFTADETRIGIQLGSELGLSNRSQSSQTSTVSTVKPKSKQTGSTQPKIETKRNSKKSEDKKTNPLVINAIAFVAILAALYYFLYADKETVSTDMSAPQAPQTAPSKVESGDHF